MRPDEVCRTPIADMVEQMLADGIAADVIVRAVATAEAAAQCESRSRAKRGQRVPADWQPSSACVSFALERGLTSEQTGIEAEKFKNYWSAKTGNGATKLDWEATWRNWIISTVERANGTARNSRDKAAPTYPSARSAPTGADAVLAGMGRLARRVDQRRGSARPGDRQISDNADPPLQLDIERGRAR
jgi:hypothetical protein